MNNQSINLRNKTALLIVFILLAGFFFGCNSLEKRKYGVIGPIVGEKVELFEDYWSDIGTFKPNDPNLKMRRGKGGVIRFFKKGSYVRSVRVDGSLTVYVFKGTQEAVELTNPSWQLTLDSEQLEKQRKFDKEVGHIYHVWLDLGEYDLPEEEISIFSVFTDNATGLQTASKLIRTSISGTPNPKQQEKPKFAEEDELTKLRRELALKRQNSSNKPSRSSKDAAEMNDRIIEAFDIDPEFINVQPRSNKMNEAAKNILYQNNQLSSLNRSSNLPRNEMSDSDSWNYSLQNSLKNEANDSSENVEKNDRFDIPNITDLIQKNRNSGRYMKNPLTFDDVRQIQRQYIANLPQNKAQAADYILTSDQLNSASLKSANEQFKIRETGIQKRQNPEANFQDIEADCQFVQRQVQTKGEIQSSEQDALNELFPEQSNNYLDTQVGYFPPLDQSQNERKYF
ncbi:MAG: hypothetical protein Q4C95_05965 [Planctomycetia bacterium]|nr:hypothetical protein [Planctomycetia bacterium]